MYRTTSVMALGLFLGLAPIGALAQTDDTDQQQMTQPSETETQQTETLDADEPEMAEAEEVPDIIAEQDESEMLASSLMGASINLADESIGTVSDLIIGEDYAVKGVVVGVGGFLGIGEKRVALPLERLTIQTPEPGQVELTANMTRDELEEKQAFRTAADIRREEEAAEAERQQTDIQQPTLE